MGGSWWRCETSSLVFFVLCWEETAATTPTTPDSQSACVHLSGHISLRISWKYILQSVFMSRFNTSLVRPCWPFSKPNCGWRPEQIITEVRNSLTPGVSALKQKNIQVKLFCAAVHDGINVLKLTIKQIKDVEKWFKWYKTTAYLFPQAATFLQTETTPSYNPGHILKKENILITSQQKCDLRLKAHLCFVCIQKIGVVSIRLNPS